MGQWRPAGPQRGLAEVLDAAVVDKVVREDENAQPVQLAARGGAREDARALGADARVPGKGGVARASKGCKKEGRARRAEEDSPKQEAPSSLPQASNPRDEVIFY